MTERRCGLVTATAFWGRVQKGDGCWIWPGKGSVNYGSVHVGANLNMSAHRVAWRLTHGAIPRGLQVLHHCDNRRCVRPSHLHLGTQADNIHDMWSRGRQRGQFMETKHCKRGHPWTAENTVWEGEERSCRTCRLFRKRQQRERQGAKVRLKRRAIADAELGLQPR